jgi:hypothetical protein
MIYLLRLYRYDFRGTCSNYCRSGFKPAFTNGKYEDKERELNGIREY